LFNAPAEARLWLMVLRGSASGVLALSAAATPPLAPGFRNENNLRIGSRLGAALKPY
jgi:hypothetical protein